MRWVTWGKRDTLGPLALYASEGSPKYQKAATRWLALVALENDDATLADLQLPPLIVCRCCDQVVRADQAVANGPGAVRARYEGFGVRHTFTIRPTGRLTVCPIRS